MLRNRARLSIGAGLVALVLLAGAAAAAFAGREQPMSTSVEIAIRFSKFVPDRIVVPVGMPITITLRNDDPIDHEWIVGDEQVHAIHRVGTEPLHPDRPTEVVIPAMTSKTTVVTFDAAGSMQFICHLPAHEELRHEGPVHDPLGRGARAG